MMGNDKIARMVIFVVLIITRLRHIMTTRRDLTMMQYYMTHRYAPPTFITSYNSTP